MYCVDRASFLYSLAGSVFPLLVGAILLAVGLVMVWRARR